MAPKQWCVTTSAQRHRDTGSRRTKNRQRCQRWGRRLPHLTKFIQNLLKITGRITKTKPIGLNISWFVVFILLVFLQLNKTSVSFRCVKRRAFNKAVLPWNLTSFILTCLSSINSFNQRHFCVTVNNDLTLLHACKLTVHYISPMSYYSLTGRCSLSTGGLRHGKKRLQQCFHFHFTVFIHRAHVWCICPSWSLGEAASSNKTSVQKMTLCRSSAVLFHRFTGM